MGIFEQRQRKSNGSSVHIGSPSRHLQPSLRFALAPDPASEQISPDQEAQHRQSVPLRYSLANITVFPPERENTTGMPDRLKAGIENLSGLSMNDVRVHSNSPQPAQVQALAYTQGKDIYVGSGQEEHLPHELWHVVQQKQGRVRETMQLRGKKINDDAALEREADVMGERALYAGPHIQRAGEPASGFSALPTIDRAQSLSTSDAPLQRKIIKTPTQFIETRFGGIPSSADTFQTALEAYFAADVGEKKGSGPTVVMTSTTFEEEFKTSQTLARGDLRDKLETLHSIYNHFLRAKNYQQCLSFLEQMVVLINDIQDRPLHSTPLLTATTNILPPIAMPITTPITTIPSIKTSLPADPTTVHPTTLTTPVNLTSAVPVTLSFETLVDVLQPDWITISPHGHDPKPDHTFVYRFTNINEPKWQKSHLGKDIEEKKMTTQQLGKTTHTDTGQRRISSAWKTLQGILNPQGHYGFQKEAEKHLKEKPEFLSEKRSAGITLAREAMELEAEYHDACDEYKKFYPVPKVPASALEIQRYYDENKKSFSEHQDRLLERVYILAGKLSRAESKCDQLIEEIIFFENLPDQTKDAAAHLAYNKTMELAFKHFTGDTKQSIFASTAGDYQLTAKSDDKVMQSIIRSDQNLRSTSEWDAKTGRAEKKQRAPHLVKYEIPNKLLVFPEQVEKYKRLESSNTEGLVAMRQIKERLFIGDNLANYMVAVAPNPY